MRRDKAIEQLRVALAAGAKSYGNHRPVVQKVLTGASKAIKNFTDTFQLHLYCTVSEQPTLIWAARIDAMTAAWSGAEAKGAKSEVCTSPGL